VSSLKSRAERPSLEQSSRRKMKKEKTKRGGRKRANKAWVKSLNTYSKALPKSTGEETNEKVLNLRIRMGYG